MIDAIIGGSLGGLSVLVAMAVVLLCWRRRQSQSKTSVDPTQHKLSGLQETPSASVVRGLIGSTSSEALVTDEIGSVLIDLDSAFSSHAREGSQSQPVILAEEPLSQSQADVLAEEPLPAKHDLYPNSHTHSMRLSRIPSSSRGARSTVPAYSPIHSVSRNTATQQERLREIRNMHSRIDAMANSPTDGSRARAADFSTKP